MYITSSMKFVILSFINFCINLDVMQIDGERIREFRYPQSLGMRQKTFVFYKSNAINERACTCSTQQSCSCCEDVTLLLIKTQRRLCANLMYQRNGLNVDISLDSNTVRSMTVTNYRPLKVCTLIPGSLFSGVCLNLVELNAFPRSLTVCPRFTITTKNQEWRINYTCVSISTELPMANVTTSPGAVVGGTGGGPMSGMIILAPGGTSTSSPAISTGSSRAPPQDVTPPAVTLGQGMPSAKPPGQGMPPEMTTMSTPIKPGDLAARSQPYGAKDRSKYFPSRHPPAYAANFGHNITSIYP